MKQSAIATPVTPTGTQQHTHTIPLVIVKHHVSKIIIILFTIIALTFATMIDHKAFWYINKLTQNKFMMKFVNIISVNQSEFYGRKMIQC